MKKNLTQKLQAGLLLAALVLAGTAFLPAKSQAMIQPDVCFELTECPNGNHICEVLFGPVGEEQAQLYVCTGPLPCV